MNTKASPILTALILCFAFTASATVHYVDLNSTNATPPFNDWSTAATNIQDAVDEAVDGDLVLVTNGVYDAGGRVVYGSLTNRVVVNKAITVQSVNGPEVTTIDGYTQPNGSFGNSSVRCVYMTNNSALVGFTLASGQTRGAGDTLRELSGGGIWCESSNCLVQFCCIVSNRASMYGGGIYLGTCSNCTFMKCWTGQAGGALYGGLAESCTVSSNGSYYFGGAAANAIINNCLILTNSAGQAGGGVSGCLVTNSNLTGNALDGIALSITVGGGAYNSTLKNCSLVWNDLVGGLGAPGSGGGGGGDCNFIDCLICSNSSSVSGGGAFNSTLSNCTLTGNHAPIAGGAYYCLLSNCAVTENTAQLYGGGVLGGTLWDCTLKANNAGISGGGAYLGVMLFSSTIESNNANMGGGAYQCTLDDCILAANSASSGGGSYDSILSECILLGNSAGSSGAANDCSLAGCTLVRNLTTNGTSVIDNGGSAFNCVLYSNTTPNQPSSSVTFTHCCSFPLPVGGEDNLNLDPMFVDAASDDFHLQSNSPCINSGNNSYATNLTDLDGNPRIVGGTVDIGAYEYQSPSSILSYAWAQQYGLPTDGSADFADPDGDNLNNWQEWIAGTVPTDATSVLQMYAPSNAVAGLDVSWQSVNTRTYYLQRSSDVGAQPAFTAIQSNIVGQAGATVFDDTTATNGGPYFYRVGVQ